VSGPYADAVERFPRLRQSRLATFDRCALSARFEEQFEEQWTSHPQARGTIFHTFAAKALRAMSEAGENQVPTDLAIEILQESLRQDDVDRQCVDCGQQVVDRYVRPDGALRVVCVRGHDHSSGFVNLPMSEVKDLRWVVVKWASENTFDIENLVSVEERLEATLSYPDGLGGHVDRVLSGQIDALFVTGEADEHAIVLDWKDTWGLPAPTELGFDGYFQQRFYAWLVFRAYPTVQRVTLREFYVRRSEPREATVYREDIEDVEAELSALAERFDRAFSEQVFPPSPGHHCHFCPRPEACPIFPGVRGEGAIANPAVARKYAAQALVAKAALDQRVEALKAYASVFGDVPISDHKGPRVWGHKERKRVSRPDREAIEQRLRETGGRLTQSDIRELYVEKKVTHFVPHVPQPQEPTADDAALMSALDQSLQQFRSDG
jgi:hypothetical protein